MTRVAIKPAWVLVTESGDQFEPLLFPLLRAIHRTHKLTAAVREVDLSYRYAWELLGKWASMLGSDLVVMQRGKGAALTPLGEKLLWVEQRTEASLFPQLENIASELNLEIRKARQRAASIIRIHASHGYAIEKIPELVGQHGTSDVELRYMGSVEALASLHRSSCDLAGFHVPLGDLGPVLWEKYAPWVKPRQQRIIRLVIRTQGLFVAKGNPLRIRSFRDLARPEVRFVHRQQGSGTRVLFDELLRTFSIDPSRINSVGTGEFTHAAVAAFVASGMADAGLGVEPAARLFNLDFLPILKEHYMLIGKTTTLAQPAVQELIALLKGPEFVSMCASVPGYTLDNPGEVVALDSLFPWINRK